MSTSVKTDCMGCETNYLAGRFILFVFLSILFTGCASVPKSFTEGTALYQGGNYDEASRLFEKAAQEKPGEESFVLPLAESHYKAAGVEAALAEGVSAQDLRSIIGHYRNAVAHVEKSITVLSPSLSKPDEGDSFVNKMQKLRDSSYKSPREQQETVNKASIRLKASSSEKLRVAQAELDKVLGETTRILSLNRAAPASAYDEYVPFFIYAKYLQEARDAKLEIEQITIKQLEVIGLIKIDKLEYEEAERAFTRMGTIEGGSEIANAGLHAITSHKAFMKKDYEAAFEELIEIRSIHPDSAFLKAYYEKTQLLLLNAKLAEVDALIAKEAFPGLIVAFEKLEKLLDATKGAAQGNATFLAMIDKRTKTLRLMVAADFIRRATQLKEKDAMLYSSLILRNLRFARQFDPEQVNVLEEDAINAYGVVSRKSEMKVYVAYDGTDGLGIDWAKRLESDLLSELEKSGVPGVSILDRSSLQGANSSEIGVADLAINGSMDSVVFAEKGRDSPRRHSSKYVSGTRQVNNPQYPIAERECRQAEATYNTMYSEMERLKKQCDNLNGWLAQSICQGAISYISSSAKDTACAKWQSTPPQVTENVISNYQYDIYTVSITGQVKGKCSLRDNLNQLDIPFAPINEKTKSEGTITANAQDTDTEGIKNAEVNVPDMANEQEVTYKKVAQAVSSELLQRVATLRAERFCKLSDTQKDSLKGLEASSMCAFFIDKEQQKRQAESETKLNAYFLISPAQALTFGVPGNDSVANWPSSRGEVDDNDLKRVMVKHGRH